MTQNCKYCTKTRANILLVFIILFSLNAVFRAYLNLPFETVGDVMLLPSLITLVFGAAALIIKYTKIKVSPTNLRKN